MSGMLTDEELHDAMNKVQSRITVELENAGFDPCPALHISQEATKMAWDLWGKFQERVAKLERERDEAINDRRDIANSLHTRIAALKAENQRLREALEYLMAHYEAAIRNSGADDADVVEDKCLSICRAAISATAPSQAEKEDKR